MSEADNPSSIAVIEAEEGDHPKDTVKGEHGNNQAIANQLMQNLGVLAALKNKLSSLVSSPSGYVQSLPKEVKRRIKALKKLQNEIINIEAEFYKEVNALELKYAPKFSNIFEKRKDILNAKREPTDEECDWPSDEEDDDKDEEAKLAGELKDKAAVEEKKKAGGDAEKKQEKVKGIPSFWLTIFKNVDILSDMIQDHDEPILAHLQDIQVKVHDKDPVGFSLEFHFEPNEYFTNTVLTKRYEMRYEPDPDDPLSYKGPEIVKCTGCTINWNKGKNVTVKQTKKKQMHKDHSLTRTEQVKADSCFNFFNPPAGPEESESAEDEEIKRADFKIGHYIKEIVPRAVLYFTGEALENDDKTGAPVSSNRSHKERVVKYKRSVAPTRSSSDCALFSEEELKLSNQRPGILACAKMSRQEVPWTVYIRNLDKRLCVLDVKRMFKPYGSILDCDVQYGSHLAYAFINFKNKEDAQVCIKREHGRLIYGENILVEWLRDEDTMMNIEVPCYCCCCNMGHCAWDLAEQRWGRVNGVMSTNSDALARGQNPPRQMPIAKTGEIPPVKERLEMPIATQKTGDTAPVKERPLKNQKTRTSLTPGLLRVLNKQLGPKIVVTAEQVRDKWLDLALPKEQLDDIMRVGNFRLKFEWNKFLALAALLLGDNVTDALRIICEILSSDPEGGPARISFQLFQDMYHFLAEVDGEIPSHQINDVISYLQKDVEQQDGLVMPRNFMHASCPRLS